MTVADTANGREEQVGGGASTLPEVPTDRELRVAAMLPAGLAALGEAGVVFLLVELAARSTVLHPSGGPLAWYPMSATAAGCRPVSRRGASPSG